MKKSRIAIAVILAVVLAVTCISVPTFSWFTRPQPESQSGANMMLKTNNTYNAYNGYGVTVWQTANHGSEDWTMRSAEVSGLDNTVNSINQSKVFRILNQEDGNHNRPIEIGSVNGASIKEYYSSITLATNAEFEAATELRYQTGATVEYYSSNSGVFTVDSHGKITGVSAGTATLYTKVVGGTYGDFIQKETEINVTPNNSYVFYDVPIVRNMKIPENGTQEVYWYVINNSLTNALSYTIDEVYIGL